MRTVLILEDDAAQRRALRRCLGPQLHYEEAELVQEALWVLDRTLVDLVLTDLELPDGLGLVVVERCRSIRVPVILLSGNLTRAPWLPEHFFTKPYNPTALRELVQQLLGR